MNPDLGDLSEEVVIMTEIRAAILDGVSLFRIEMPKGSFMIPNRYKAVQRITLRWHTQ
jgi:hypothetical protein